MFAFVQIFFAVLSSIYITGAQAQGNCARTYTVKAGDTCASITATQGVSRAQLDSANPGKINNDCSNIVVGQTLCLGLVGNDCQTVHVVTPGETCATIAAGAGISFDTLRANNANVNSDCSNIFPGEALCIAA
ncbi:hypothetical protein BD779DRAFT_1475747 [Infundibulicybe gibba]|nr:hypothetical protein BD779DRAFT_1475747 [Infundibulicybe gibba]